MKHTRSAEHLQGELIKPGNLLSSLGNILSDFMDSPGDSPPLRTFAIVDGRPLWTFTVSDTSVVSNVFTSKSKMRFSLVT